MIEDKFDLTFYCGEDLYSDGDVENELLEAVQKKENIEKCLKDGPISLKYMIIYQK